jgi:hypothetical protein
MRFFVLVALCAALAAVVAPPVAAGPLRNRASASSSATYRQTPAGSSYSASSSYRGPAEFAAPALAAVAPPTAGELAAACAGVPGAVDGLDELNVKRARMGLYPYTRDDALTMAAARAARHRAERLMFGHEMRGAGDFQFLPGGATAAAAGCAAYPDTYGWMSCEDDGRTYRYAGAAWVRGADGKRYMHLFVR